MIFSHFYHNMGYFLLFSHLLEGAYRLISKNLFFLDVRVIIHSGSSRKTVKQ